MELCLPKARVGPVRIAFMRVEQLPDSTICSVHFPGAVNSKFTTDMSFQRPSTHPAISTYRVMDSDGAIVDQKRKPLDVSDEDVVKWYRDMLTGTSSASNAEICTSR